MEDAVRAAGAVPATVAVLGGRIKVGLSAAELKRRAPEVAKCSTRDLPMIVASGGAATTIAATVFVAARAGIRIMATGGLGGVHQGGERSLDVSADLEELARTPITVVCSGVKSILDQARTVERLETLGVPVVGWRCDELPGFYAAEIPGCACPGSSSSTISAACTRRTTLGLRGLVVVQRHRQHAMARARVERLVEEARTAARARRIRGAAFTPFMLQHMGERSAGATVGSTMPLAVSNASLAGALAAALAGRERT